MELKGIAYLEEACLNIFHRLLSFGKVWSAKEFHVDVHLLCLSLLRLTLVLLIHLLPTE